MNFQSTHPQKQQHDQQPMIANAVDSSNRVFNTTKNGIGQIDIMATSPNILNTDSDQFDDRMFLNSNGGGDFRSKKLLFSTHSNRYAQNSQIQDDPFTSPCGGGGGASKRESQQSHLQKENQQPNSTNRKMLLEDAVHLKTTTSKQNIDSSTSKISDAGSKKSLKPMPVVDSVISTERNKKTNPKQKSNGKNIRSGINAIASIAVLRSNTTNKKSTLQSLRMERPQQLSGVSVSQGGGKKDLWGWVNLKKRIDALKQLLKNLELMSMIQIKDKLKHEHTLLINDKGSNLLTQNSKNNANSSYSELHKIKEIFNIHKLLDHTTLVFLKVFESFPIVNSTMLIVVFFKIILSLQLLYQIFQLPLMVSFPDNSVNVFSSMHGFLRFLFVLPFILEILLNFNLSYYEYGVQITDKSLIIRQYLGWEFWQDLVGVFGSAFLIEDASWIIVLIIFVIRFMKLKIMYDSIEERFQLSLRFSVPYTLLNLFLSTTMVAHICGCIFQMIAFNLQSEGVRTWLEKENLQHGTIADRYIAALYFAFITMITVGYGDIVPITNDERVFVIFMTIFGCGVFAYVVGSIGDLFSHIQAKEAVFKQQKYEISNYMETRQINANLQTEVFQFLDMLRRKKQQEPESGQGILDIVNPKLRDSIYQNYYGGFLKTWPLFAKNFSKPFLDQLSVFCTEQVYGPGEIIFYQQELQREFDVDQEQDKFNSGLQHVYLIIKGKVALYEDSKKFSERMKRSSPQFFTNYEEGECFGVKEFLHGIPNEFSASSQGLTTLIKVQRNKFTQLLKSFPKDLEAFAYLRDELQFANSAKYVKCDPCNRYDHSLYSCPRMHFLRRKYKAIQQATFSCNQEREMFVRGPRQKQSVFGKNRMCNRYQLKMKRIEIIHDIQYQLIELKYGQQNTAQLQQQQTQSNNPFFSNNKLFQDQADEGNNVTHSRFDSIHSKNDINQSTIRAEISALAKSEVPHTAQLALFWQHPETKDTYQQQLEEDSTISLVLKTQRLKQFDAIKELIEIAEEEIDEIFYFKCPLVSWNSKSNEYMVSQEIEDEEQCNEAIQQYLEDNFDLDLDDSVQTSYPLSEVSNDDQLSNEVLSNNTEFQQSPDLQPKHISYQNQSEQLSTGLAKIDEVDMQDEDVVRISDQSLSFFDEYKENSSGQKSVREKFQPGMIEKFVFHGTAKKPKGLEAQLDAIQISMEPFLEQNSGLPQSNTAIEMNPPQNNNNDGVRRKVKKMNLKSLREQHVKEHEAQEQLMKKQHNSQAQPSQQLSRLNSGASPLSTSSKGMTALKKLKSLIIISATQGNTLASPRDHKEKENNNNGRLSLQQEGVQDYIEEDVEKLKDEIVAMTKITRAKIRSMSVREKNPVGTLLLKSPEAKAKLLSELNMNDKSKLSKAEIPSNREIANQLVPSPPVMQAKSSRKNSLLGFLTPGQTNNHALVSEAMQIQEWNDFMFAFEHHQEFTKYYPKFNRSKVLVQYLKVSEGAIPGRMKATKPIPRKAVFRKVESFKIF